ncbi:MAG: ZIP family metal transporter [bacterium]|nr:ZIP family metal transporter [bacterium]
MSILFSILISTSLISLIAFAGAVILFLKEELLNKILLILVSFAAGALIGSAFLHLVPEAIEEVGIEEKSLLKIFLFLLFGFCAFFVLENSINWHHHHAKEHPEIKPFSYLILISDGVHNFIDGLIIAGSFIISIPLGIITALAVAFHEIPQEIGDFGILIYSGFEKIKALFLNFLSAITIVFGGVFGFLLSERMGNSMIFLLPFAAGSFIYIACSDLIPEIKHKVSPQKSLIHFFVFLLGIVLMLLIKLVS